MRVLVGYKKCIYSNVYLFTFTININQEKKKVDACSSGSNNMS